MVKQLSSVPLIMEPWQCWLRQAHQSTHGALSLRQILRSSTQEARVQFTLDVPLYFRGAMPVVVLTVPTDVLSSEEGI